MPASARSLKITESYRTRMIGLRNRAKAEAKRTWSKVDPDALDATFNPGMLVLMTAQLQREAARLSAGYLAAYVSSEKGERVPPPMAVGLDVGKVWTGSSLTKAFRGAVIGTKIQIGDGKEPIEAYKEGGQALVRTAGLAVDDVCRESLRVAMDQSPDVNGYVRAVKGTCEACLGAADGATLEPGEVLDTHPNCQCVSEPVIRGKNPGEVLPDHTKNWSQDDWGAIKRYIRTTDSYVINSYLRDVIPNPRSHAGRAVASSKLTEAEIRAAVKELDELIERAGPLGTKVRTTRVAGTRLKDSGLSRRKLPYTMTDDGFGSTAAIDPKYGISRTGVRYDLDIDPRVKALWGSNSIERELLLQRGCRWVIRSIEKDEYDNYRVRADVLPPK